MKTFSGFPSGKVRSVTTPEPVFTDLIPIIDDLHELKLSLHVIWRLGQQQKKIRYVSYADLAADEILLASLGDSPRALETALARAVERGTLLQASGPDADIYFANTPKGRAAVEAISNGQWPDDVEPATRPNVFALYEQNIGMLTPLIAEEFREAVSLNKRSWKYIRAILERWRDEGKGDETGRRPGEADRQRYIKGEYGEYIEH
jgi:DNA replication protein